MEIERRIGECDFVRFTFSDIHGISRGKSVAAKYVLDYLTDGIGIYAGSLNFGPRSQSIPIEQPGQNVHGNTLLKPIPETFHLLPYAAEGKYKVGQVLCENYWPDGSPCVIDPRYVLRAQINKLQNIGYELLSGWEQEFFIYNSEENPISTSHDYSVNLLLAKHERFLYDLHKLLTASGIDIETIHNEADPGQFEMATHPVQGVKGVDAAFICKQAIKEICQSQGMMAVYMAQPAPFEIGELGNALQFNMSLLKGSDEKRIFYSDTGKYNLSDIACNWIGGILKHSKAISALGFPTVNCYRTMHKPECPHLASWSDDKRDGVVVRLKNVGSPNVYLEFRLGSGAANPYLVAAAVLAAGLDGLAMKTPLPEELDQNAEELPSTLEEALDALEKDSAIIEALGQTFVESFIKVKRQIELKVLKDCGPGNESCEAFQKEKEQYLKYM